MSRSSNGEGDMRRLTAKMETVRIPSESDPMAGQRYETAAMEEDKPPAQQQPAQQQAPQRSPQRKPSPDSIGTHRRRLYELVLEAGPPADPIGFPQPQILRGRRGEVCCYNPKTRDHEMAKNVLFRDYSREYEDGDAHVTRAFWPVPFKRPIRTIMGHVEICRVLKRCGHSNNNQIDDSSSEEDDEEDDIIFELTDEMVAVKVCYSERMEELRHQHAEDPVKEIAAMQIIGNEHPNVIGCIDVLFDGQCLNVVMQYCGSGDLFQLLQNSVRDDQQPGMTESQARYWFRQVIAGLKHIHHVGICHRDLSPENVMIDGSRCLIIDFGMSIRVPYSDPKNPTMVTDRSRGTQRRMIRPQGACGKLPYMSPEIYRNKDCFDGFAIDAWGMGALLFCMLTGNRSYQRPHPSDPQFYWMTKGELVQVIIFWSLVSRLLMPSLPLLLTFLFFCDSCFKGLSQLLADWNVQLSREGVHLLQNMLQIDPGMRLSIKEIEGHPWFAHPDEPHDADDVEFQL